MTVSKKTQRIPVRRSGKGGRADAARADAARADTGDGQANPDREHTVTADEVAPVDAQSRPELDVTAPEEAVDWRDMALRLRADMDNYRKRQQRIAEEQIAAERRRLLAAFLAVPDNLERIVAHLRPDDPHQQSIKVVHDDFMKLLRVEGVEPLDAVGAPFDPMQHDAAAMIPAAKGQRAELLVVDEERKGYRIGTQILRPARVIVAKR
jgi:molecular chaperone GrpE